MATAKSQRIGIWIIAIALTVGTLGGFLVMILAPKNQEGERVRIERIEKEYQAAYDAYQKKVDVINDRIAAELSTRYFETFHSQTSRIGEFDAASVDKLTTEDITQGDGEEVTKDSSYSVYYFGWNPSGKMFDSSFNADKTALGQPLDRQSSGTWVFPGGQTGNVITGWSEGVLGMKIGGIRELTLPADKAYGEQGGSADIPPNTPLKFVLMVIPTPDRSETEAIEQPKIPQELNDYYRRNYGTTGQ
jgi:FKBP-type peptidyl-prolyl cis-trans isomerase